jgi:hypothetical protein
MMLIQRDKQKEKNYEGKQYWLNSIAAAIGNARSMDTTCKFACELDPISYDSNDDTLKYANITSV